MADGACVMWLYPLHANTKPGEVYYGPLQQLVTNAFLHISLTPAGANVGA